MIRKAIFFMVGLLAVGAAGVATSRYNLANVAMSSAAVIGVVIGLKKFFWPSKPQVIEKQNDLEDTRSLDVKDLVKSAEHDLQLVRLQRRMEELEKMVVVPAVAAVPAALPSPKPEAVAAAPVADAKENIKVEYGKLGQGSDSFDILFPSCAISVVLGAFVPKLVAHVFDFKLTSDELSIVVGAIGMPALTAMSFFLVRRLSKLKSMLAVVAYPFVGS